MGPQIKLCSQQKTEEKVKPFIVSQCWHVHTAMCTVQNELNNARF